MDHTIQRMLERLMEELQHLPQPKRAEQLALVKAWLETK